MNDITHEMEILGNRIDAVKKAVDKTKSVWGKQYLGTLEKTLTKRWKRMLMTRDHGYYEQLYSKNESRAVREYDFSA